MTNRLPPLKQPPPSLATLRLIVTALVVVSCVAGGAVLFSAHRIGGRVFADPVLGYIIAGCAAMVLVLQFLTARLVKKPPADADETTHLKAFGTMILARVFLLETALAVCYIFYLLSLNEAILAAGIVLVLAMILLRPSAASYQKWRERLT